MSTQLPELAFEDATALAARVRDREVSPVELLEAAIARIEALNPALNAVVTPMFDEAALVADRVDRDAPLAGVPTLVKDLVATCAGVRQTNGSRFLRDHVAQSDSALVRRLRAAGLVIAGKTNTSELGATPVTEGRLFGATRNPWDLSLSPAGSSGGSAAAVAAGIVPIAHGNDSGGSLRNPASCCGLFALKPSRGRMPSEAARGDILRRFFAEHALTRSVRDSALLLDLTHGALPGDPYRAPAPAGPYSDALRNDNDEGRPLRLRIAVSTEDTLTGGRPHPDCAAAAERAARLCSELGHEVVEAQPVLDGAAELVEAWFAVWSVAHLATIRDAETIVGRRAGPDDLEPLTWSYVQAGLRRSAAEHARALDVLARGASTIAEFLDAHDVWLTPTLGLPSLPVGVFDANRAGGVDTSSYMAFSPYTRLANLTGAPAMSVPLHRTAEGFPVGAHFLGRMWEEGTLLALAAQLEEASPWRQLRPPVCAANSMNSCSDSKH
jgi:amidase